MRVQLALIRGKFEEPYRLKLILFPAEELQDRAAAARGLRVAHL
jgi:hypothetical protein